jgi:putative oxidoreductase
MKDILDLLGRILIAFIFLYEAYDSIAFFKQNIQTMTDYGITWNQELLLYCSIFLLLLGGILILIGYRVSLGAFCLLLYWVPLTFILYSWWNDPEAIRRINSLMFMKNMAIAGGLLMIGVNGAGRYSVRRILATTRVPSS